MSSTPFNYHSNECEYDFSSLSSSSPTVEAPTTFSPGVHLNHKMGKNRWKKLDLAKLTDSPDVEPDKASFTTAPVPPFDETSMSASHLRRLSSDHAALITQYACRRHSRLEMECNEHKPSHYPMWATYVNPDAQTWMLGAVPDEPSYDAAHQNRVVFPTHQQMHQQMALPCGAIPEAGEDTRYWCGDREQSFVRGGQTEYGYPPTFVITRQCSRPPSFYPAVKGTNSDAQYNKCRTSHLQQPIFVFDEDAQQSDSLMGTGQDFRDTPGSASTMCSSPVQTFTEQATYGFQGDNLPSGSKNQAPKLEPESKLKEDAAESNWFYTDCRFDATAAHEVQRVWSEICRPDNSRTDHNSLCQSFANGSDGSKGNHNRRINLAGSNKCLTTKLRSDLCEARETRRILPALPLQLQDRAADAASEREQKAQDIVELLILPLLKTLRSYQTGPPDYFTQKWVQPPEWCIDRSVAGVQSSFGEDWGTPPARVGRDPRYRLAHSERRAAPFREIRSNMSSPCRLSLRKFQHGKNKQH